MLLVISIYTITMASIITSITSSIPAPEILHKSMEVINGQGMNQKQLEDYYQATLNDKLFRINASVSVSHINKLFVDDLSGLLMPRTNLLNSIKYSARELIDGYVQDPDIKPYNYFNRRYVPPNPVRIESQFSEKVPVSINRSHVQCSTEIYQYAKDVLNIAKATEKLDEVFRTNYAKEPSLLWQFFCSIVGTHRAYPGRNSNRKIDLYDCRRRLWYNQAINSPKDVVIALDMSGSMTGSHFTIAKLLVQSLIDTLQQDDFFNVLYFNEETKYLIECLNGTLAQGTSYYKNQFKQAVTKLSPPTSISNFPIALRKSFELINSDASARDSTSSSNCNKVIMLISDGIDYEEATHEILEEMNPDQDVVIFSYIVGQASEERSAEMKDIACQSGGDHYTFMAVGNVLDGVLKYQKRLSLPLGLSKEDRVIFTPLYLDGSGLGMMTTISTAVFSVKNDTKKGELIGVAGMDIVISLLQQQYPVQEMGVFGHAFAINNNGLFLMHPKFKDQTGYLPDPATVYLDEVELTTDKMKGIQLKEAMINGETDCMNAEADWLFPKLTNRRVVRLNNTYCYQPMKGTPFYAGVSMPQQNKIQMVANKDKSEEYFTSGIESLNPSNPNVIVEIAEWSFCNISTEAEKLQPASKKYYPTAKDLYEYLRDTTSKDIRENCKEEMLLTLLLSASVVTNFTKENWSVEQLKEHNITDAYVITSAGFTYMLQNGASDKSIPIERDIFNEIRFIHPASFYQKEYHDQLTFSVTTRHGMPQELTTGNKNNNNNTTTTTTTDDKEYGNVAIGSSVYMPNQDTMLAVVGMTVTASFMQNILQESAKNLATSASSPINCSTDSSTLHRCYIIDENGYVVTSNRGLYKTGYFIGYFEGYLLEHLTNIGVFDVRRYNDTQADCPPKSSRESVSSSPGNILRTFYYTAFNLVYSVCAHVLTVTWWILSSLIIASVNMVAGGDIKNVGCTKTIEIYLLKNRSISIRDGLFQSTVNCNQSYTIESIAGTNLAHIVIEDKCINGTQCPLFSKNNEPKQNDDLSICEQPLRYRRALSQCYKLNGTYPQECSYINENKEPNITIYIIIFVSICVAIIIALVFNMYFRKYFHGRCC